MPACSGDMYSGVPIIWAKPVNSVLSVSCCPMALATPKSITLTTGVAVVQRDQDVGRLEVAVDDALLMGVLHRLADRHEQLQPLPRRQVVLVAELGDRHALDQLHHEVRPARGRSRPPSNTLAMFGWSMMRQGLPLGLEAGDHLAACPCPA